MPGLVQCYMPEEAVSEAFLAAPPLISQQILDLTVKHPNWMRDLWELAEWPRGNGTIMEQLVFRGMMPQIERGFDAWKKLPNNTGCAPCAGPDCSYVWTQFGGYGFQKKIVELMTRDFRSPAYCVKEIQTTAHFKEVFAKLVENLYAQIDFFKEMNIGFNFLVNLAKKFVVDSGGAKPNPENPYVYRNIGDARVSMLNIEMLERFYEYMRRLPDAVPYDVVNGSPIFALECSHQLLGRMYRDDPELRQDVRFSGLANDLLMKYNFMSTIRGMFIAAPILYPRRFNIVAGEPVEVLPFLNGVPADVGTYTSFNPDYEEATHEEVLIHGKYPFKVWFMPTEETLGAGTSFGPEQTFMNAWQWVNPQTVEDPARRVGYFFTSATIGLAQQFSEAIFGILVERPSVTLMGSWLPAPECPPEDPDCDNEVPDVGCPCPLILQAYADPINDGQYIIQFSIPQDLEVEDEVDFQLDNGGFITGTVEAVNENGDYASFSFPNGTDLGICDHFVQVFCDNTLGCFSEVLTYAINASDNTRLDLVLANPIKADTAADVVVLNYGNGEQLATATVVSVDMSRSLWVVDTGGSAWADNVGGVVSICVPNATDESCPGCDGPTYEQCEEEA